MMNQTTVIILVSIVILVIVYFYMNRKEESKLIGGGTMAIPNIDNAEYSDVSNILQSDNSNLSPQGANNDDIYARLSDASERDSEQVKPKQFNVDDLLPSDDKNEWFDTIKVADPKLINVNRCMGTMTTKKCCTRDFRGDIPIQKDSKMTWNMSPIEPSDLIETSKLM